METVVDKGCVAAELIPESILDVRVQHRPVIGITTNHEAIDATLRERYYKQVVAAGGVPVLIPPVDDEEVISLTVDSIDALILSGGGDHDPKWQGEERSTLLGNVNEERDRPELMITRIAAKRQLPILGICRGMQTMAVALGGKVAQDLSLLPDHDTQPAIAHSQAEERDVTTHGVRLEEGSLLQQLYGKTSLRVNSFHHQAVRETGSQFYPIAFADDGVIEAMTSNQHKPWLGVQWHPEWLGTDGGVIFRWLVDEAALFRKAKTLHDRIITIDSHCDTPMFFKEGADFSHRDSRILVDVEKMADGRQDAVTMVAYIPQSDSLLEAPEPTQGAPRMVTAKQYADIVFDRIEDIVAAHPDRLALARNRADIIANKCAGRKSIMLGIENARALEDDINNVDYFANRGVVYFTLCHNGDNQICDSARGNATWGGISPFGKLVVERMNKLGVTVDLSHAAESTFYDAISISSRPVVCSHSNCRSLCDHPRNLTDDQLRTLAKHDGVCQITLYHGFVDKNPSEADIRRAIDHLNHAVSIMGIDHVGLGTDFDGDGGLKGLADSSEMTLFTRQLLRQRYSDADIEKIWGANWLRRIAPL